jgi:hypothetical protein
MLRIEANPAGATRERVLTETADVARVCTKHVGGDEIRLAKVLRDDLACVGLEAEPFEVAARCCLSCPVCIRTE